MLQSDKKPSAYRHLVVTKKITIQFLRRNKRGIQKYLARQIWSKKLKRSQVNSSQMCETESSVFYPSFCLVVQTVSARWEFFTQMFPFIDSSSTAAIAEAKAEVLFNQLRVFWNLRCREWVAVALLALFKLLNISFFFLWNTLKVEWSASISIR